jgi:hypothetical protein
MQGDFKIGAVTNLFFQHPDCVLVYDVTKKPVIFLITHESNDTVRTK